MSTSATLQHTVQIRSEPLRRPPRRRRDAHRRHHLGSGEHHRLPEQQPEGGRHLVAFLRHRGLCRWRHGPHSRTAGCDLRQPHGEPAARRRDHRARAPASSPPSTGSVGPHPAVCRWRHGPHSRTAGCDLRQRARVQQHSLTGDREAMRPPFEGRPHRRVVRLHRSALLAVRVRVAGSPVLPVPPHGRGGARARAAHRTGDVVSAASPPPLLQPRSACRSGIELPSARPQ